MQYLKEFWRKHITGDTPNQDFGRDVSTEPLSINHTPFANAPEIPLQVSPYSTVEEISQEMGSDLAQGLVVGVITNVLEKLIAQDSDSDSEIDTTSSQLR